MNTCEKCKYGVCKENMAEEELGRFVMEHCYTMRDDYCVCRRYPSETVQHKDYCCGEYSERATSLSQRVFNKRAFDAHLSSIDRDPFSHVTCVRCGKSAMKAGCVWKTDANGENAQGPFCSTRCSGEVPT